MAFKGLSLNAGTVGLFFVLTVLSVGTVEGLLCNQCGTYILTSVTPCLNLTKSSLMECPPESTHCAKYVSPAMVVYGCEKNCEERTQWSFDIHCCSTDQCNGANLMTSPSMMFLATFGIYMSLFAGYLHFGNPMIGMEYN